MCARDVCAQPCVLARTPYLHTSPKKSLPPLNKKRKKKSDYFLQWWVAKLRDDDCLYPEMTLISYRTCLCWTSGEQNSCNNTSWYNRNIQFLALWNENWAVSAGVLPLGASCTVVRERGGERHRARDVQRFRCMDRRRALNSPNGPSAVRPNTTIGSPRAVLECSHTS